MTPIERIEADLHEKKLALATIQAEVNRLEQALQVLRAVPDSSIAALEGALAALRRVTDSQDEQGFIMPASSFPENLPSLAGMTIPEAAARILADTGRAMHFREVAAHAMRRGYGGNRELKEDKVINSFAQILRRDSEGSGPFLKVGAGRYRLRT